MNGSFYRGRAGIILENEPDKFMTFRLEGVESLVTFERVHDELTRFDLLAPPWSRLTVVRMELSGTLSAGTRIDTSSRPEWADARVATPAVQTAPRALDGR